MKYDVMIIIDMQTALINNNPYQKELVLQNIKLVQEACRKHNIEIVYIRHDGGVGDELEKGTLNWQICQELSPNNNELIIDKQYNSAFRHTNLNEYLKSIEAKNLIMCGMQTEYCFDVTCKVAYELGYHVTIPKNATTTFDNEFFKAKDLCLFYEEKMWNHRYGNVVEVAQILETINKKD